MFQLDDEEQKRFYEEQRNGLDEERRSLLETYERSLFKARHVELQVLEWENARHKEALAQHFGSSTDDPSTKAHDLHAKCRETQQFLTDLVTHQNALDEQIEALMTLKQPVQHETTYLFKNPVNKARSYNITVASTPSQPKLTFEQFCQRLFTPAQDAVRVEHTLKREVTQMAEGLLSLQRSVKAAVETIDRAEEAAQTKSKTARIQSLVQRIHKMDRLAFMTVLEHINLKKRLLAVEKSRTAEVAEMYQQCELIDERKRYLQEALDTELQRLSLQHRASVREHTEQLGGQQRALRSRLKELRAHKQSVAQFALDTTVLSVNRRSPTRDVHPSSSGARTNSTNLRYNHQATSRADDAADVEEEGDSLASGPSTARSSQSFFSASADPAFAERSYKDTGGSTSSLPRVYNRLAGRTSRGTKVQSQSYDAKNVAPPDPLVELQASVARAKRRYEELARRNQLEMEGYASEVLLLRQRLRQLERTHVRMAQLG